jgi:1-acyl-sn-glycerol-3-phosphate acyltransferase
MCSNRKSSNGSDGSTSTSGSDKKNELPEPAVWVCNHTSMLDVFLLMAADRKLRGRNKRPMKIAYWQQLEDNPVTKLLAYCY